MVSMPDASRPNQVAFEWTLNWKLCLFSVCLLPLLVGAGFWQLNRAQQKITLQQSLQAQQAMPALSIRDYSQLEPGTGLLYRPVQAFGEFLPGKLWLLENKVYRGKVGFEVIMPFRFSDGTLVLVNRGWVVGTGYRDRMPEIATPAGRLNISGWLTLPSKNRLLAGAVSESTLWPKLILAIDVNAIAASLQPDEVLPQVLQLAPESPAALVTNWQPINLSPEKHRGYAVQWFAMACALILLTFFANTNVNVWFKSKFQTPRG